MNYDNLYKYLWLKIDTDPYLNKQGHVYYIFYDNIRLYMSL